MTTRRRFIRTVGIAIASLAVSRCTPTPEPTCYTVPAFTPTPGSSAGNDDSPRGRLRQCWMSFDELAQQTRDTMDDYEIAEAAMAQLVQDHQAALDDLVLAGDLEQPVADQVQAAFDAAVYHVWRSNAPITCYEAVMIDFQPTSSAQLVQQAETLDGLAGSSDVPQETLTKAQAAIERDIAFLSLPSADVQALYDQLIEAAGDKHTYPSFDELELDVTPEAAAAARFLVQLLIEN